MIYGKNNYIFVIRYYNIKYNACLTLSHNCAHDISILYISSSDFNSEYRLYLTLSILAKAIN